VPDQTQPGQVVLDTLFELGCGAGQIGVVDAQDKGPALPLGEHPVDQRRAHIAYVQLTRRRRGETNLDGHGETLKREARRSRSWPPKSRRDGSVVAVDPFAALVPFLGLDREGRGRASFKPAEADRLASFLAVAVGAVLNAAQRLVDLGDQFAL